MNIEDIRQGVNGDCFILASLVSILNVLGEKYIEKLVYLNETGKLVFSYYIFDKNKYIKHHKIIDYNENEFLLSPKSKIWVKHLESAYIKTFYNSSIKNILKQGGIAFDVFEKLLGRKSKIFINRIFDNKEKLYYVICNETICNKQWKIGHIQSINKSNNNSITKYILNIWNCLSKNIDLKESNKIYMVKNPCVIGINSVYTKINIPGIINDHLYAILGIMKDSYNNLFIEVFNTHYNVDSRQTKYNNDKECFESEIKKGRKSIWSLYEIVVFSSDVTFSI